MQNEIKIINWNLETMKTILLTSFCKIRLCLFSDPTAQESVTSVFFIHKKSAGL